MRINHKSEERFDKINPVIHQHYQALNAVQLFNARISIKSHEEHYHKRIAQH